MTTRQPTEHYRRIKKYLNRVHRFSFAMPRKGKDFSAAQKSGITSAFNRYGDLLKKHYEEKISFIPYPKGSKLPHIDGRRTNKGIFYKFAGAKSKKLKQKGRKKWGVEINFKKIRGELFVPFPPQVVGDPAEIKKYVEYLQDNYAQKNTRMGVNGGRGSQKYNPDQMDYYTSMLIKYQDENELNKLQKSGRAVSYSMWKNSTGGIPYFNGVFLEF